MGYEYERFMFFLHVVLLWYETFKTEIYNCFDSVLFQVYHPCSLYLSFYDVINNDVLSCSDFFEVYVTSDMNVLLMFIYLIF